MRADHVKNLYEARVNYLKGITIDAHHEKLNASAIKQFSEIMTPYQKGTCPIRLYYNNGKAAGDIALGEDWLMAPEDDLLHKLREMFGNDKVHLRF
jgi:DNA polymerase-3 subunit alpha